MPLRARACTCRHVTDSHVVGMHKHAISNLLGMIGASSACSLVALTVAESLRYKIEREIRAVDGDEESIREALELGKQLVQLLDDTEGRTKN